MSKYSPGWDHPQNAMATASPSSQLPNQTWNIYKALVPLLGGYLSTDALHSARVISQHADKWTFHDARGISRFYASDKYTCFLEDGTEHLLTESLRLLEARLSPFGFLRVHRAELINTAHIYSVRKHHQILELRLLDGQRVCASRRYSQLLKQQLCLTRQPQALAPRSSLRS